MNCLVLFRLLLLLGELECFEGCLDLFNLLIGLIELSQSCREGILAAIYS